MQELTYALIASLVGFAGLVWSADKFVEGSASIARAAGLSTLVIGLTIVSLGTSAPEIIVSLNAALDGSGELAIGNAIGSNLANIGLVLGATALIATLPVQKHLLQHEMPILILVTLVSGILLFDAKLEVWEGFLLVAMIAPVMAYLVWVKKFTMNEEEVAAELDEVTELKPSVAWMWFAVGLILLVISAKALVWGATEIALYFEVSPLIIGLTVVAIGTSLPELAASVASALKGHHDIALGNVIGSNIFNLLAVMSIPSLIAPLGMEPEVFSRDYAAMAILTALLVALMLFTYLGGRRKKHTGGLGRFVGVVLLSCYGAYYVWLFQ